MRLLIPSILILMLVFSCKRDQMPEDVLREFIDYRFSKNQNMDKLLSYTTGRFRASLEDFIYRSKDSDLHSALDGNSSGKQTVSDFLDTSKLRKKAFKVLLKKYNETLTDPEICHITYVVTFDQYDKRLDEPNPDKDFMIEVKKIATLERSKQEKWKISEINNIKTYIDSFKEIQP